LREIGEKRPLAEVDQVKSGFYISKALVFGGGRS